MLCPHTRPSVFYIFITSFLLSVERGKQENISTLLSHKWFTTVNCITINKHGEQRYYFRCCLAPYVCMRFIFKLTVFSIHSFQNLYLQLIPHAALSSSSYFLDFFFFWQISNIQDCFIIQSHAKIIIWFRITKFHSYSLQSFLFMWASILWRQMSLYFHMGEGWGSGVLSSVCVMGRALASPFFLLSSYSLSVL